MWILTLFLTIASIARSGDAALPCDSVLRVLRPNLFTHCGTCFYGSWSSWTMVSHPTPSTNCKSGYHYKVQRNRYDNYGKCSAKTEINYQCEPTLEDKGKILISSLDLHTHTPTPPDLSSLFLFRGVPVNLKPTCGSRRAQICARKRRSIMIEEEAVDEVATPAIVENTEEIDGITTKEFNLTEYLFHIKKHHKKRQTSEEESYVLFILDSSGSVKKHNFEKMKTAVANLSVLFCNNVKIAVMAYSTFVYQEVCFGCEQSARNAIHNAIKKIKFQNKWTATGDAVRCACNHMLNTPCDFDVLRNNPPSVRVVLITDGYSNIGENPCSAIQCLKERSNLSVFPIGVGKEYRLEELHCLKHPKGNDNYIFNAKNLDELLQAVKSAEDDVLNNVNSCVA